MEVLDKSRTAGRWRGRNVSLRTVLAFLAVGGFATLLHYVLIALFVTLLDVPFVGASVAGFAISAVVNYALNARFTFRSRQLHRVAFPRFLLIAGCGLALNWAILAGLIGAGAAPVRSQFAATIVVLAWNYLVNALWTFRHPRP